MKVMQATLHTHTEWFKLQMCKDRFESFLKIDTLKEVNSLLLADTVSKSQIDAHSHGSSQLTISSSGGNPEDSNSPTQVSSQEVCDEGAILKVMVSHKSCFCIYISKSRQVCFRITLSDLNLLTFHYKLLSRSILTVLVMSSVSDLSNNRCMAMVFN